MSDEQKQKQRDYQIDYRKKYYAAKKLNKIINDNDNDNKIIDYNDNDSYCMSKIIKLKNIVPIKYINSILKINKKVCSLILLMIVIIKGLIIFLIKPSGLFFRIF